VCRVVCSTLCSQSLEGILDKDDIRICVHFRRHCEGSLHVCIGINCNEKSNYYTTCIVVGSHHGKWEIQMWNNRGRKRTFLALIMLSGYQIEMLTS